MFKNVDLFTKRYVQISMVFMLFAAIQQTFHIPHDSWIIITSAMLYSGFNPGTVLKRAYMRFNGTIVGIAAVTIAWYFMHYDYRLAIIFLLLISGAIMFFMGLPYNRYMIIVTLFSDIMIQWDNPEQFDIRFYVVDRFMCTAIVFALCLLIEYLWFGKSNFTSLNHNNLCASLKIDIQHLHQTVQNKQLSSGLIFKEMKTINLNIDRLELLINDARYENSYREFNLEQRRFGREIVLLFRKIVSLHYLQQNDHSNPAISELNMAIRQTIANFKKTNQQKKNHPK